MFEKIKKTVTDTGFGVLQNMFFVKEEEQTFEELIVLRFRVEI